jgi:prevent-host-death family protein
MQLVYLKRMMPMPEKVSTLDVRQRIGDLLNRVALRHDEFIIERKGKPLAALVPVERLEQMRRFARRHALEVLERQASGPLSDEQAMELALEAQRAARGHPGKQQARTK